jgi:hypothetical protein
MLEGVGDADLGPAVLDLRLDQLEIGIRAEAERVEPFGFGTGDVTWCGTTGWVGIFVKADQRLRAPPPREPSPG